MMHESLSVRVIFYIVITCFTEQLLNHYFFVQENFCVFTKFFISVVERDLTSSQKHLT